MSKTAKHPTIVMPTREQDEQIVAAAKEDPDAQPLTARQLRDMVPIQALRGRPKSQNAKQLVSIRYSAEVIAYFKSTADGWQSRMDDVLRDYVALVGRAS